MKPMGVIAGLALCFCSLGQVSAAEEPGSQGQNFRKCGFVGIVDDGRLWVFLQDSEELAQFRADGELAKHVTRPGGGPGGMTIKAPSAELIDLYMLSKPGFVCHLDQGRLWVFRPESDELASFHNDGELAKHVIRPGIGPRGLTIKAPDTELILAYLAAQEGFETIVVDGRIWVFRAGCPELEVFRRDGELAKNVTRPGAGPARLTVRAPDAETIDAYLKAVRGE